MKVYIEGEKLSSEETLLFKKTHEIIKVGLYNSPIHHFLVNTTAFKSYCTITY